MAINMLAVCALCCCANARPALGDVVTVADQPAADSRIDTGTTTDARMKSLAERLAHADSAGAASDSSAHDIGSGVEQPVVPAGQTPLVSGTPLLRPGQRDASETIEPPDTLSWMLKTFTALGVVIGLALAVRFVYARMGGKIAGYASPVVEVLSRTTVAPRSHVMLLRVGGRVLVVSESSAGMRTLASVEDPQEVADILGSVIAAKPTSISRGFSQLLGRFTDDQDKTLDTDEPDEQGPASGDVRRSVSGLIARVRSMGREGGAS